MKGKKKTKEQLLEESAQLRQRVEKTETSNAGGKEATFGPQERERWSRAIFEETRAGIVITDNERILEANPAYCEFIGYDRDELLKMRVVDVTFQEDLAETRRMIDDILSKRRSFIDLEKRYVRKDGSVVWGHLSSAILVDSEGKPSYSVGIVQDITEQKRSEEEFKDLFDNAPIGYHTFDTEGRITRVNRAHLDMLGYCREEMIGEAVWKFDRDADPARDHILEKLAGLRPPEPSFERTYRRKDGTEFPVLLQESLNKDEQGRITGIRVAVQDITRQKQIEGALRESEARFRSLVEEAPEAIYVHSGERYLYLNPAMVSLLGGSRPEDLLGEDVLTTVAPEYRDAIRSRIALTRTTPKPLPPIESERLRLDGMRVPVESTAVAVRFGGKDAHLVFVRDITERKRAEALLRESEARFRSLFEAAPEAIFVQSGGCFVYLNPAMVSLLGGSKPEYFLGKEVLASVAPEYRDSIRGRIQLQQRTGKPVPPQEEEYLRVDGTRVPVEGTAVPVRFEGKDSHLVFVRDITERKRTEDLLRESEERFRSLVEGAPEAIFVQSGGCFVYVNPAMLNLLGAATPEELLGKEFLDWIGPEYRDGIRTRIRLQERTGEPVPPREEEYLRADGTRFPVEAMAVPIRFQGKDAHLTFVHDITERKRAEDLLRESEERFRALVEGAPEAIYVHRGGRFLYLNPEMVSLLGGSRPEDFLGKDILTTMPPEYREVIRGRIALLQETGKPNPPIEMERVRLDGTRVSVESRAVAVRFGGKDAHLVFVRDITERRERERQLQESDEKTWRLAQEIATVAELGRIVGSTLDIDEVYERFAEEVRKLIPSDSVAINKIDAEKDTLTFLHISGISLSGRQRGDVIPLTGTAAGEALSIRSGLIIDLEETDDFKFRFPVLSRSFERGLRSMMVVPLFSKDRIIGTITFFSARPGTYSGQHLKLAESIAAQIAGAVANEQLYAELKQREEQLKESEEKTRRLAREIATVAEIGRIIGSTLDIDEVYERFAEEVRKLIPFDSLVISGINAGERTITFLYASGILLQGRQKGDVFPIADTPAEELLRTGAGLIGDLRPDGDFGRRYSVLSVPYASGLRTMMAIPLVSKDRVIAVLNFFSRRPGVYTGREMDLAGSVAAEIAGAVASARLYVEREQAEASVRKSEAKFRELFDDAPVGYFEYDTQGRLNNVNKTYMEMLGYCAEEMLGHPSWEFSALEEKAHQTILSKLAGALPPDKNFERNFRRKDGSTFPGLITDRLILDEQGKIVGNRAAVQDITERKRAEESLIESQMRLKKAQAIGHLGNWEIDLPTRSVWASEEAYRIYGIEWKNESLPLELVQKAVLPEYRPEMDEALRRLISENKEYDQQYRIKRANDGEVRFLHSRAERILDEKGNVVKVAGVIQDITDRKRTEDERERLQAQLIQAQKMESVGRLAGGVAHDFNNKLSVIIGYGELALEQTDAGSPLFEHLDQILDAARGAADLTRQLLAFARKQTVSPKVLDLNDTTSGMLKMLRRLIGEEINLVWTPGANLWKVKIDPSQIDQILANLAVNARDAISGTGTITLKTGNAVLDENDCSDHPGCVPGKYVMLTVSDTGSGMSKEVMAKIFEPFFTTKGVGKGTGLGLATVYGIVNQNNGFLDVESEPGKGATFNIYLPRFAGEQISVTKEKEGAERGTETILLVEDEISVLNLSKKVLESLGYTILPAQTAEQAIRLIRDHEGVIHLLITDVVMPEMNGKELFEKIAAVKPGLRCLYMSGYTTDVLGKEGVLDEGVHFIQKPFKKNEIAKKISDILKIRP